jgi:hypothetical protein
MRSKPLREYPLKSKLDQYREAPPEPRERSAATNLPLGDEPLQCGAGDAYESTHACDPMNLNRVSQGFIPKAAISS